VEYCLENGMPVYPGVATASEIEAVLEAGLNLMKLWPIETLGGVPYLQLLGGPFVGVEFNPSGGVTATNFTTYLNQKNVVAVGGNWMAPPDWISAGQFDRIREIVRQTVTRVAAVTQIPGARSTPAASRRPAGDQSDQTAR
jgi:2-dehydro-3-deoxyphosphogluconate aldolase / (4S)-4-hydroxy-2-oxoglutarate aldolase